VILQVGSGEAVAALLKAAKLLTEVLELEDSAAEAMADVKTLPLLLKVELQTPAVVAVVKTHV
jgi:hypothetical protein